MVKYAYYPGCTQESTAEEFGDSSRAACGGLGIELADIPDWCCCGASSGHAMDEVLSHALPARNLALAERMGLDIAVVCAACYLRLRATLKCAREQEKFRKKIEETIGMPFRASCGVRHLLEIVMTDVGLERVSHLVKRPLTGLRAVCYYGCYLVRPPDIVGFDDPENPVSMDRLIEHLGGQSCDWAAKVDCCGGSHILSKEKLAQKLIVGIIDRAREVNAEAIVVACPMCHANLDMRQKGRDKIPVIYFTELIGLALGIPAADTWFAKHIVSPMGILQQHGLV